VNFLDSGSHQQQRRLGRNGMMVKIFKEGRKGDANFFLGSFVLRLDDCCRATLRLTYGLAAKDVDAGYAIQVDPNDFED
jgi:hypothetical protein